ncbi:MAG: ABC transporter permease subunit [Nitriliruptorales bacterium]|nr:ABC transporter permease subunit [Nitriliruptorales bacterium]
MKSSTIAVVAGTDWRLVLRKELADLLGRLGRKPLTRTIGVVAIFGILIPLRFQQAANLPAFFATFMAFVPARLVAIESFAGERERGTLDALLALPLTDKGIALGKIAAATTYGAARGWLFVAAWVPTAAVLRAAGVLPAAAMPAPAIIAGAVAGSLLVAMFAAVFGVWQSARAPSVRAIVESGGILRLVIILGVFFVGPWLLGFLSPEGATPTVQAGGWRLSVEAARAAVASRPGVFAAALSVATFVGVVALAVLLHDTFHRCRREALAMVPDDPPSHR